MLLVESHRDSARERALLFSEPSSVIACQRASEVQDCLARAEQAVAAGKHLAGFLAYEAGYGLSPKLATLDDRASAAHALWLGVFEGRQELLGPSVRASIQAQAGSQPARVTGLDFDLDRSAYAADFARIQDWLRAGESYQVCHSLRARLQVEGSPWALFGALRERQRTQYSALLDTGDYSILSLSPELFFRKTAGQIELKPMKGTSASGRDALEDERITLAMQSDPKTRAENVMIVDLLRNDIGRLAKPGGVQVTELFGVERFDRVLQMTSSIVAEVEPELGLGRLMTALFPSGSVTGAPKVRTMQLIRELETSPRGIFCGSIGYVTPQNDACFNVAIRSLLLDRAGQGLLGVGSGVVIDSQCDAEFEECLLKAGFLGVG